MTRFSEGCSRIEEAFECPGLSIPVAGVKFYFEGDDIPPEVLACEVEEVTLTSCQSYKQSTLGDAVLLTRRNIGCIAAAISFGLVDENAEEAMEGPRVYTEVMRDQSGKGDEFAAPSPKDFTEGTVYACADANRPDFCLFGKEDSGRFKDVATSKKAVEGMLALQPAKTIGVFYFDPEFDDCEVDPDVVVYSARPAELTRLIEGWMFMTGERIQASMGMVRVVNSDLAVRPFVEQKINVSTYCVGARVIGQHGAERLGMGIPWKEFLVLEEGMQKSRTGFPFKLFPGACGSM